ncbi:MAG: CidA/LrgA family protein [Bacteroidaceae bacterium]|nr:CidA/LrgA family protein [Bacteroidaceae bacterium]
MRYVLQLLLIIAFSFMGEILQHILPFPIPASIYGIALLYGALQLGWIKVKHIREVSTTLIMAMPVMFVPPAVGLMSTWNEVADNYIKYLIIIVTSTFIVMGTSALLVQSIIGKKDNKNKNNETTNNA